LGELLFVEPGPPATACRGHRALRYKAHIDHPIRQALDGRTWLNSALLAVELATLLRKGRYSSRFFTSAMKSSYRRSGVTSICTCWPCSFMIGKSNRIWSSVSGIDDGHHTPRAHAFPEVDDHARLLCAQSCFGFAGKDRKEILLRHGCRILDVEIKVIQHVVFLPWQNCFG